MSQKAFSIKNTCTQPLQLFSKLSLRQRLLFLFLPLPILGLVIAFSASHTLVEDTLQEAVAKKDYIQSHAMGYAVTQFLDETRNQIATLAAGSANLDELRMRLRRRLQVLIQLGDMRFRETAFWGTGKEAHERYLWVTHNEHVYDIPEGQLDSLNNSPFNAVHMPKENEVLLSQPTEVVYSLDADEHNKPKMQISMQVLRFTTPVILSDGTFAGYLTLSVDLSKLRDVIAKFAIKSSEEIPEKPLVLFVDNSGWMIFQMNLDGSNIETPLDLGRAGMQGDFGRPGFSHAFRPNANYFGYWQMIKDIRAKKTNKFFTDDQAWNDGTQTTDTVSYAPVTYQPGGDAEEIVLGGIVTLQPTFAGFMQGKELSTIYFAACSATILLMLCCTLVLSSSLKRKLSVLRDDVEEAARQNKTSHLPERREPDDIAAVRSSINNVLDLLRSLEDEKDKHDSMVLAKVQLEEVPDMPQNVESPDDGLIGVSREINQLKQDIQRVASSQMDVLVTGETGTGKELTSRAIHNLSDRRNGPYITINCGALDEALLMDTLFGHVKGAYTEAKNSRKGAFLTAEGGTLMLDEIGTASAKVQIALLRALSERCIHPLGSDTKVPFNTRVIAATNADLQEEVAKGNFREDLYFRLAVVTIHTPALRERKMDIPYLIMAFMQMAIKENGTMRDAPGISKGALSQMMHYHWPGNVRELRNVVSSAVSFCEGDLILPKHLRIGDQKREEAEQPEEAAEAAAAMTSPASSASSSDPSSAAAAEEGAAFQQPDAGSQDAAASDAAPDVSSPAQAEAGQDPAKNSRQKASSGVSDRLERLLPKLQELGTFSRQDYQDLASVSMRTAQYDLQELLRAGLAVRHGRGPSMRYTMQDNG